MYGPLPSSRSKPAGCGERCDGTQSVGTAVCLLVVALIANCNACPAQEVQVDRVREHMSFLASPERKGRTESGKVEARDYIVDRFREFGLTPLFGDGWLQTVPGWSLDGSEDLPPGFNIGGFVAGTDPVLKDEWLIVNAHYDHLGVRGGQIYPGADDNASGVAMLIEVARAVSATPLKRSVAFVSFDFEESLVWGSRWFTAHPPLPMNKFKLCVTADMISRSLGGLSLPTVFVMGAEHSSVVREALVQTPVPTELEVAQLGADMIGTRSDYGPFRDQNVPFLFFSTGEHPDYHTPRDTLDRVDFVKATRVSNLILSLVTRIGNGSETPEWSSPQYQKLDEARAVCRVTDQLLTSDDEGTIELSDWQRFFVSQVHAKTSYMLRVGRVSDEERQWMSRSAQVLLLSVF